MLIGITTFDEMKDGIRGEYSIVSKKYADSVIKAGGIPILIPLNKDVSKIKELVERLDGVIFSGGDEYIQPKLYNRKPTKIITQINPIRDLVEMELLKECLSQNKGVFGICRGMQLINVFFGGDLYLDINTEAENSFCHMANKTKKDFVYHDVNLVKDGFLNRILKEDTLDVNTYHSQGVRNLGKDLKVSAVSEDGIIESMEHDNLPIIAVQWHPEALTENYNEHLEIFKYFIEGCRKNG